MRYEGFGPNIRIGFPQRRISEALRSLPRAMGRAGEQRLRFRADLLPQDEEDRASIEAMINFFHDVTYTEDYLRP